MYLIIGLGNPEEEYAQTRHNMGFDVINKLEKKYTISVEKKRFKGIYGNGIIESNKVILLKPQTYMNLSGESVREIMDFYKVSNDEIIVIYFSKKFSLPLYFSGSLCYNSKALCRFLGLRVKIHLPHTGGLANEIFL
mgnify:CR=1 FL=1